MKIATGEAESHPTPLPYNPQPPVAPPTPIVPGQLSGPTVPARDCAGEYAAQMAAQTADWAAAQAAGHAAETGRRTGYEADIRPLGASYGDEMILPLVVSQLSQHTGGRDAGGRDPGDTDLTGFLPAG